MIILQIEHPVKNYAEWKKVFDSDPMNRKASGVISHRISMMKEDPDYILIELEFEDLQKAEAMLEGLRKIWRRAEGTLITGAKGRVTEILEQFKY